MNLKGTKSEQNVKDALAGESLARNKYTYYALQAKSEGHDDIAGFFEKMADNEREHAKIWFKILNDGLGNTSANLEEGATGESYEWQTMYPQFAIDARAEGLDMLAAMFEKIAAIENDHEKQFLEKFMEFKLSKRSEKPQNIHHAKPAFAPEITPARTASDRSSSEVKQYRCMFCGNLEAHRLDVCPVCEAIGAFELIK